MKINSKEEVTKKEKERQTNAVYLTKDLTQFIFCSTIYTVKRLKLVREEAFKIYDRKM